MGFTSLIKNMRAGLSVRPLAMLRLLLLLCLLPLCLLALCLVPLCLVPLSRADAFEGAPALRIIVHPDFQPAELTKEEIRAIFLFRRMQASDGTLLQPAVRNGGAAHDQFCESFLEKTAIALDSFYRSRLFSGNGFAPRAFSSEAALQQYVARSKGAIGYVLDSPPIPGVKVLTVRLLNAKPAGSPRKDTR
jgi:hypothetical protein